MRSASASLEYFSLPKEAMSGAIGLCQSPVGISSQWKMIAVEVCFEDTQKRVTVMYQKSDGG
jgi:hypothetical protein